MVAALRGAKLKTPPVDARDALLAHGLFRGPDVDRDVRGLSVGQRRRLDLAVALASRFDLLLLDEPTNHLDPELVEQLEGALVDHPAAVVTVTHDRRWRRHAADARCVRVDEGVATT